MALAACAPPTATPAPTPEPVRVVVTDLAAPLLADLVAAYRQTAEAPAVTVLPAASLAAELQAGRADLAFSTSPASEQFASPVAYASFAVIVHPNNPMTRLSLAQVRAAFTGQVADWAQVGGDSGALQIVTREDGSEGAAIFNTRAGLNAPLTRNTLVAPTWEAMRATVGQTPTALGYLPAPEMDESVRAVQLDAELRVLIVAVAQTEPVGRARDFLVWVQSDVGQQAVAQHYEPVK